MDGNDTDRAVTGVAPGWIPPKAVDFGGNAPGKTISAGNAPETAFCAGKTPEAASSSGTPPITPVSTPNYDGVLALLKRGQGFILISHVSPDGDTLGSALGLAHALRADGRVVICMCPDAIPERYGFMPGISEVLHTTGREAAAVGFIGVSPEDTVAIAIDVSDHDRLGNLEGFYDDMANRACIDHHGTNPGFAQFNCIDPDAAATAEVVYELIRRAGLPMPPETVTCLFTGISTDTGHFNFDNTTPRTLRIAADLVAMGVDISAITRSLYRENSLAHARLKARATLGMRLHAGDSVATIALTPEDFLACGAADADSEAIIDVPINIRGVRAAALLRQQDGRIKVSFRACAPLDVAKLAQGFGGGGHPRASGATLDGPLERAEAAVAEALTALVREYPDG